MPKPLRAKLAEECYITAPAAERKQVSKLDGTIKYLWRLRDGNCIETVLMRYHAWQYCVCILSGRVQHGLHILRVHAGR